MAASNNPVPKAISVGGEVGLDLEHVEGAPSGMMSYISYLIKKSLNSWWSRVVFPSANKRISRPSFRSDCRNLPKSSRRNALLRSNAFGWLRRMRLVFYSRATIVIVSPVIVLWHTL